MRLAIPSELQGNAVHILSVPTETLANWAEMLRGPLFQTGYFPPVDELYETLFNASNSVDSPATLQLMQEDAALLYWAFEYHNDGVLPPEAEAK